MGDESDSAKKIDAGQAPPSESEQRLVDYGLLEGRKSTRLAGALVRFADKQIDRRGLTGRYSGIDAYQEMLCALYENTDGCVDRRPEFATTAQWLFWLIGSCVDDYKRHPEPPLGDEVVDLPGDDDVEEQVAIECRIESLQQAVAQVPEFNELIKVIDFRDDRETLAEMLGMDTKQLRRLLARFDYFVKKFRS